MDTIPGMQYSIAKIAYAINLYYEGLSLDVIRHRFLLLYYNFVSDVTILNWVSRFTKLAVKEYVRYKPQPGSLWVIDENVLSVRGKNLHCWDIIDLKTRYLLNSYICINPSHQEVCSFLYQTIGQVGKHPEMLFTDTLCRYLEGIKPLSAPDSCQPFVVVNDPSVVKHLCNNVLNARNRIMQRLHTHESARLLMEGWRLHYNCFRHQPLLEYRTPANMADLKYPHSNWDDMLKQLYDKTIKTSLSG